MKKNVSNVLVILALAVLISYSYITPVRAAIDKTYEQLRLMVDVMGLIDANYVEKG